MVLHPGTSRLVPPSVLLSFRIFFAIFYLIILGIVAFFLIISEFGVTLLFEPITWNSTLAFFAFVLLAMCSNNARRQTETPSYAYAANILLHASTALFLGGLPIEITRFTNVLYYRTWYSARGLALIPPVTDILLGSNIEFKYKDIWIPVLVFALWNGLHWAVFPRYTADEISRNVGFYIGAIFAAIAIYLIAAALLVLITNAYRRVRHSENPSNQSHTEMPASVFHE